MDTETLRKAEVYLEIAGDEDREVEERAGAYSILRRLIWGSDELADELSPLPEKREVRRMTVTTVPVVAEPMTIEEPTIAEEDADPFDNGIRFHDDGNAPYGRR